MTNNEVLSNQYIWISHELRENTPAYGGGESLNILREKKISNGASCNSAKLLFPNHLGTHVDVPYHFIETGKKVSDYNAYDWFFHKAIMIEISVELNEIIVLSTVESKLSEINDVDLLLIKTGFEKYRNQDTYWLYSPAFIDDIAYYLKDKFPSIAAIGFDSISLTGYQHRELGRKAHKAFLSQDIRIFEDLHLSDMTSNMLINQVIAMPLRFENSDGSPCTIIAKIEQ